jgi:ferrous iron transport protein A
LAVGRIGIVVALDLPESVQNHLMHMGFVPEARVVVLRRAPAGDPTVYAVDGMEIALRRETAAAIRIRLLETNAQTTAAETSAAAKAPFEAAPELTGVNP